MAAAAPRSPEADEGGSRRRPEGRPQGGPAFGQDRDDRTWREGVQSAFDESAAEAAARIAAERRRAGRPVEIRDIQIAGIARARKATLATRKLRHFEDLGLHLVDPWAE